MDSRTDDLVGSDLPGVDVDKQTALERAKEEYGLAYSAMKQGMSGEAVGRYDMACQQFTQAIKDEKSKALEVMERLKEGIEKSSVGRLSVAVLMVSGAIEAYREEKKASPTKAGEGSKGGEEEQ